MKYGIEMKEGGEYASFPELFYQITINSWFKTMKFVLSQLCRPEVQSRDVLRALLPLQTLREYRSLSHTRSGGSSCLLVVLSLQPRLVSSHSLLLQVFSSISYKANCHWI